MPTGYTHKVQNGEITELKDFAVECAKAFMIQMRDAPANAPLPDKVEPDTAYYDARIAELRAELEGLAQMTHEERAAASRKAYDDEIAQRAKWKAEREEQRDRYTSMQETVQGWRPPTDKHQGLKDFMLEQLRTSIQFDCSEHSEAPVKLLDPMGWWTKRINTTKRTLDDRILDREKIVENARLSDKWLQDLRTSLKP